MAAPYSYAPAGANNAEPPQRPAFDLDDLLGTGSAPAPPPPGSPPNAPPPPPPPNNDDPFGFGAPQPQAPQQQPQQAQQASPYQYQQPQQQNQPAASAPPQQQGAAYTYAPPQQPQQPQQPPQPQQQQAAYQYQQPQAQPQAPAQHQTAPYTYQPPQQPHQQQQPQQQPPTGMGQRQDSSAGYAAFMSQPQQPQQPPAPQQPQQQAASGYPPHYQPQQQPQQQPQASAHQYPPANPYAGQAPGAAAGGQQVPAYGYAGSPSYATPGQAPQQQSPPPQPQQQQPQQQGSASSYQEDQDRANLERIRKLREQLEREQAAEHAIAGSPESPGAGEGKPAASAGLGARSSAEQGWACPACTFRNKNMTATKCEVCEEPRAGYTKPASPPPQSSGARVIQATAVGGGGSSGSWTCEMCQGSNTDSSICRICNSPRPAAAAPKEPPQASAGPLPPNVWACNNCTLHNPVALPKCQACGYAKPGFGTVDRGYSATTTTRTGAAQAAPAMPTVWSCGQCTYENKVANAKCEMCDAARPAHIAALIQAAQRAQQQSTASELPLTINGRRLTAEEQQRLVRQQEQLLAQIQNGGASHPAGRQAAASTTQRRVSPQPAADEDSDEGDDSVQWQRDQDAKRCTKCDAGFGLVVRRHHCRMCGFVFCKNCSNNFVRLKPGAREERVCNDCYKEKTNPRRTPPPRPASSSTSASRNARSPGTAYPADIQPQRSAPAPRQVPCDCIAADQGLHGSHCPNNRANQGQQQQTLDFFV